MSNLKKQHFIIASPRSGTTWISKALDAHPQLYCTERRLFGSYSDVIKDEGVEQPRLRCTLDKFVSASLLPQNMSDEQTLLKNYINALIQTEKEVQGAKVTIDKITPYIGTAPHVLYQLNTFFPGSKIVHLMRDGRDVNTSGVFHWFNKMPLGHEATEFERDRKAFFTGESTLFSHDRFFTDAEIKEWAETWAGPVQISQTSDGHPLHTIRYEDMLENLASVLAELFNFLNLNAKPAILEQCLAVSSFKKMSGREQGKAKQGAHVRKGIAGDWKNYFTRQDAELFHSIAGGELISAGYEADDTWVSAVPEVFNVG